MDSSTKAYQIENLDVYRKTVSIGTRIYRDATGGIPGEKVREAALSMVINLATGLGFWEKEWKVSHFRKAKQNALELIALLEILVSLGAVTEEKHDALTVELSELSRTIGSLARQAERRAKE